MSDYHINIFHSDEDAAYVADIPDLDGYRRHSSDQSLLDNGAG